MKTNLTTEISDLSAEKLRLLELLLKEQGVDLSHSIILPRGRDKDSPPASFSQQRLWFLDQLEPGRPFYNIPFAVRLKGALKVEALEGSVNEIVRRHETLRTTFSSQEGMPVQLIAPALSIPMPFVDLCSLSGPEQQIEVNRLAHEEAGQPFDLGRGPLLRIRLLNLAGAEHVVLLTMHHIISDGWSIAVFIREMAALYMAFSSGEPSPLPEIPIQYADFALWQREWLKGEVLDRQIDYWKGRLGGELPVLELPTDRPRPAVQSFRGSTLARSVPRNVREQINAVTLREGATLFMTLLAAFQILLYRYGGQEDICVGTPVANRNRAETEPLIGFFVNTLVMRIDLGGEPTFRELLRRVRETTLRAYENQDVPFEMVVEAVSPQRDNSYNPLFQAMFILQNATAGVQDLPGLSLETMEARTGSSTFDLTMSISESPQGLDVALEYNTDLFDRPTMERFLARFETLLRGIAADPDLPIGELPLLTDMERDRLLQWNKIESVATAKGDCVHQLFEARAALTPDAVAVVVPGLDGTPPRQVTYGELNRRANRLARRLMELGVGPETVVGICMERSTEMIETILAILKSGGAYLALDPAYPPERLRFMVEDSGVGVILTQEKLRGECSVFSVQGEVGGQRSEIGGPRSEVGDRQLPPTSNLKPPTILSLDTDRPSIARESDKNPGIATDPSNLAYVVYTSGSTGRPKGVLVRHRGLLNACLAWEEAYGLDSETTHLQMANFAFDVFSGDLVRAVCPGGRLVLCPRELLLEPKELYRLMLDEKIQCAEFVPAVLRNLIDYLAETTGDLGFMRLLVCGSDLWSLKEYKDFRRFIGPDTRIINSFGLAEATIDSTYFEGSGLDLPDDRAVPMGRPFAGSRIHVLDRRLRQQPIGVSGELFVGGLGVARGYLQRPDLTAERFVPDPFGEEPGARLYKTGDMARYLDNGNVEFLGRMDHQIKIRGFRVETGEIEATLKEHPAVQDAVVIAAKTAQSPGRRGGGDSHQLAAYVVARSPGDVSLTGLRDFLKARLPDYMIPAAFILLDSIPLSPNGKVDRKALPPPESTASAQEQYVAPRTPTEEMLAGIWRELLGPERVGVGESFFELGGHSLLATQLVSRVRSAFQVEIPLRTLFEWPALGDFARQVEIAKRSEMGITAPPIVPVERDGDIPLSFSQQRLWFFDQLEPESPLYNVPDALRLSGRLDVEALGRSVREIVTRHEILRTTFPTSNGNPRQVIASNTIIPLPIVDLRDLPSEQREKEVQRLAAEEARRPFHLAEGPLLRTALLRLDEEEHVALLTMHHIVSDGWSAGVLVQEMASLYHAFVMGKPSPLERLPIQYADFACWQRQWLQGEVLETQLDYWKRQLSESPPFLALPADRPRPAYQTDRGGRVLFSLPQDLCSGLKSLGDQEGATLFMTLLAGFKTLLFRYTGEEDICVGTPIANRNRSEIERMIGCFINTVVLRTGLSGDLTFRELLHRVRKVSLEAYMHQDLPFEMVVDALSPDRDTSHSPLFQVMFVLQNAPMEALELPGLTKRSMEVETGVAAFDLTLVIGDGDAGLNGSFEYNSDLFDAATMECLAGRFLNLLEGIAADPDRPLSDLPLLGEAEEQRLLVEWNSTAKTRPHHTCVHNLFEEQADRTPEAVAVVWKDHHLTYGGLNRWANRVAHRLRRHGVGPDTLVALCLDRSPEMIIGLLGILKAGGAYVPMAPSYPPDRLAYMIEDSLAQVILTQEKHRGKCSVFSVQGSEVRDRRSEVRDQQWPPTSNLQPPTILCLDTDWSSIARESDGNPGVDVDPSNLMYVIYTSGSTGRPKGVMVGHRGVLNHNLSAAEAFRLQAGDRVLQFATIGFDAAVEEIFPTLEHGATLVLRPDETPLSGREMAELVEREGLTILDLPTAYWHEWVYELSLAGTRVPEPLRVVVVGGETASAERLSTWEKLGPHVSWINTYGPTEGAVIATLYERPKPFEGGGPEPQASIGRSIANMRIYLPDRGLQPVPPGVPGEIHIGGPGVARGYHHRPDLTAELFIPDPFSGTPGALLYRTGDLARYLPDGNLEFIGRMDHQVKIRGFRVEPGEIETALKQHPGIKDAAVIAADRHGLSGGKALAAYLVPTQGETPPSIEALRGLLGERLPNYMIPAAFTFLDSLPLTSTGKIDRRALPSPEQVSFEEEKTAIPPATEGERIIARIWSEVLGLERVSVDDNFFELGGDSILAVQVIARANQAGLGLSPRQLFEMPTVAGLARVAGGSGHAIRVDQGTATGPVPLTPVQQWFFEQQFPEPHHWNQALLLRVRRRLDPALLFESGEHLLAHHDGLRLRFEHTAEGWSQVHADRADGASFTCIDLSEIPEGAQGPEIDFHCAALQASLSLSDGPLSRMAHFDLGSERPARLLLVFHHLVMDGVSWRILLQDLLAVYEDLHRGMRPRLPPKTTSFQYWAEQLKLHAGTEKAKEELPFWLNLAKGAAQSLPMDHPDGANTEDSAEVVAVGLGPEETETLLRETVAAYRTEVHDALLAALLQAVCRWTGRRTMLVEIEGHGREPFLEDADVSRTVGWFTSCYPAALSLPRAEGPGELLMAVKEQLRRIPSRGFGFGVLRYLCPDREVAAQMKSLPRPQIGFNYLGQFDRSLPEDAPFEAAAESRGPDRSPRGFMTHLLEINGGISQGRLNLEWTYSRHLYGRSTIEELAREYLDALRAIIAHCRQPEAGGVTPSDFALAGLNQKELDKILARVGKRKLVTL